MRTWLFSAAVNGFLAVAAGAFATHGLSGHLSPAAMGWFETGAKYQAYHALALLALAALGTQSAFEGHKLIQLAGACFTIGILLFSGSLYALALTSERWLGAVTPLGGIGFLLGWGSLATLALPKRGM